MKMKLITVFVLIIIVLMSTIASGNEDCTFEMADYSIRIGNDIANLKYPVYVNGGRTYVPLREMCDKQRISIEWDDKNREVKMDIYNKKVPVSNKTPFNEDGVIPDAETALVVGRIILEKYAEKPMEYETDEKIYYLKVNFIKESNSWNVTQFFEYKDGRGWSGSGVYLPNIELNKNTGEVIYINTYSSFQETQGDGSPVPSHD